MPLGATRSYPRRILLVLSGMSPQVVTGTLYGIMHDVSFGKMPTEVHLIATLAGAHEARIRLLDGPAYFLRFCKDYRVNPGILDPANIHVITDKTGAALQDIRSAQDSEDMADFVMNKVRELTVDPDSQLHLSISGGRKTMSFYGGYAMTMYGREQDIMSHVLVSDSFESVRDYFYPTPYSEPVGGGHLDAREAKIELTRIPYLRVREALPKNLLEARSSFREALARAQKSTADAEIKRDDRNRVLILSGEKVRLPRVQYAVYTWMTELTEPVNRSRLSRGGKEAVAYASSFVAHLNALFPEADLERTASAFKRDEHGNEGMRVKWLSEKVSEINTSLKDALGGKLADKYKIKSTGRARDGIFFLDASVHPVAPDTVGHKGKQTS